MSCQIYCIEDCNGLKYVGSTIQTLKKRFSEHKRKNTCSSRKLELKNSKIYQLEECDECERKIREQYWIDHTNCVNQLNTIHYPKEHYQKTKQRKLEYVKQYELKNKEKIKQTKKEYYFRKKNWGDLLKIDVNLFLN